MAGKSMNKEAILALHKKYAPDDLSFELVYTHCEIVTRIALEIVEKNDLDIDADALYQATMLHDIGAYTLYIPELKTFKQDGYKQHAMIGATILAEEGFSESIVAAVRTHVLMGLTGNEIRQQKWKLPYIDTEPASLEAELVCYADRFHSKNPQFNSHETFLAHLRKDLPDQANKFQAMIDRFGLPDIRVLAEEYGHKIV